MKVTINYIYVKGFPSWEYNNLWRIAIDYKEESYVKILKTKPTKRQIRKTIKDCKKAHTNWINKEVIEL